MIDEKWIARDLGGSTHSLTKVLSQSISQATEKNHENLTQDSQYTDQYSNLASCKYKCIECCSYTNPIVYIWNNSLFILVVVA
jgi:hypothetical protein